MSGSTEKPFYTKPPWNILFELDYLKKLRLWEIDLVYLLRSFLEKMEGRRNFDFRASGVALDSSAEIYLMKAKLLLKLEEPPPRKPPPRDYVPAPLMIPARYELTSTTLRNLLEALDAALKGEVTLKSIERKEVLPPPPEVLPPIDLYLLEMEKYMESVFNMLLEHSDTNEVIRFSKFVEELDKLDIIRNFITLLFLAQRGRITLRQDEKLDEIYISIPRDEVE